MRAAIPPEFETFAREEVAAGRFESLDDAVAAALRSHLDQIEHLRAALSKGIATLDRGEGFEGQAAMRELIADMRARHGG